MHALPSAHLLGQCVNVLPHRVLVGQPLGAGRRVVLLPVCQPHAKLPAPERSQRWTVRQALDSSRLW